MGTWGAGSFENDDAADWAYTLETSSDAAVLRAALRTVSDGAGYLEAPDAVIGLAAAEVVAGLKGHPSAALPGGVRNWMAAHPGIGTPELAAMALRVIARVTDPSQSELHELWADSDTGAEWMSQVTDLQQRLTA